MKSDKPYVRLHSHRWSDQADCGCEDPYQWQIDAPAGLTWSNDYRHPHHGGRHPSVWPTQAEAMDFAFIVFGNVVEWIEDGAIRRIESAGRVLAGKEKNE